MRECLEGDCLRTGNNSSRKGNSFADMTFMHMRSVLSNLRLNFSKLLNYCRRVSNVPTTWLLSLCCLRCLQEIWQRSRNTEQASTDQRAKGRTIRERMSDMLRLVGSSRSHKTSIMIMSRGSFLVQTTRTSSEDHI